MKTRLEERDADETEFQSFTDEFRSLDDELFEGGKEKRKKTRSEKREENFRREEQKMLDNQENAGLNISAEEMKHLQESDPTLEEVRKTVETKESTVGVGLFKKNGLLYRRWLPKNRDGEMYVEQLVLPQKCRETVMKLAHSIPLAGHLGKNKTTNRVLQRFYWPTLFRDIAEYCRSCSACQLATGRKPPKFPLIPRPIITEPFSRIAMDIVGPLPLSRRGNRYILVVCDYATWYPEAVALKTIDAETIAEELVTLFSRVGIPQEILTDQGANFTSHLLTELYKMLRVRPIRTTPYHPQTDGLVERFNQTLKHMLRKSVGKGGKCAKDWDTLLPYLLFAYREVPQSSTGFSPFELLYGHAVRGPLDLLGEVWQESTKVDTNVISHVLAIRERLDATMKLVEQNLSSVQRRQKEWYDQKARQREFLPDDQVLILLPTSQNKLMAKWQGPYRVVKKIGKVNYLIDLHDRQKQMRIYHVNLLKKWETPVSDCYYTTEVSVEEDEEEGQDWRATRKGEPKLGEQLTMQQKQDLQGLMAEFVDVLQETPGRTDLTEHSIYTGEARPVRLPPYRIPHAYREAVQKEIKEMLKSGIIEPSHSEWSSPIVVVPKKDGSIRMCVDFRRLNSVSPVDPYPMPRTDELIDRLGQAKYISTLDLAKGYWQVPVREEDKPKTAFSTPNGLFQFRVMPFGLSGAPATFQRMMDRVIQGLDDCSGAYIDDIIVYSESWTDHLKHLRQVLIRLRESHLTAKPVKCQLGMRECSYLGHIVGNGQVKPDSGKLQAVQEFPVPTTKKQVRGFLGLTGYYRKFIANYSSIAAPLTDMIKKQSPDRVQWTNDCRTAFETLKAKLCKTPVLANPDFSKQFILQTDASNRGVGAVLSQLDSKGCDRPVAYFSRKLLPREQRYSTVEQECLAIKLGVEAFKVYLIGRHFIVQTDHRSLKWLNRLKENNSRLTRWSLALQPFSFTVEHRAWLQICEGPEATAKPMRVREWSLRH